MTAPKFTVEQGEHGPEYFEGESKLAFTNASGTLQFTRGNAERREELEAWNHKRWSKPHVDSEGNPLPPPYHPSEAAAYRAFKGEDGPTGEPASSVDEVPSEHNKQAVENVIVDQIATPESRINLPIICPIVGASHLGDKDPAVVDWWRKNHPEEFKKRYHGRRLQSASGIIV